MTGQFSISQYRVEPTTSGWRVRREASDNGFCDSAEIVLYRGREVALAYADAAAALEQYLSSLDQHEDAAELFESWRHLDDLYERLAIEEGDSPRFTLDDTDARPLTRH